MPLIDGCESQPQLMSKSIAQAMGLQRVSALERLLEA